MDKITPKTPNVRHLKPNLATPEGRDEADRISLTPRTYRTKANGRGLNAAARSRRKEGFREPLNAAQPLPARSVSPEAKKQLTPGEARSLHTLKAQANAPLPESLDGVPPYQHIWISHQFDELYAPAYNHLRQQAEACFAPDDNVSRAGLFCGRLGRHLIFNGFALARDFITSKGVRAKEDFQDREALAIEVLEKLYAFTLAKMEAGTFNLQDFVHVNLLMALLIDWRKGVLTEFMMPSHGSQAQYDIGLQVNEKNKTENILNLKNIFSNLNQDLGLLNLNGGSSIKKCVQNNIFFINLLGMNKRYMHNNSILLIDKNEKVMQGIESDLYEKLAVWTNPYFAYTDKRSGISEERYVKAFFDNPRALITVFNPHAGHFGRKDSGHPSSRFSQKPTGGGYLYEPHRGRLSTLTEIDHDYRHMTLQNNFMKSFKEVFGFDFKEVMKLVEALLKDESVLPVEKKILAKLNFFLIHEVSTLLQVRYKWSIFGQEQYKKYPGFLASLEFRGPKKCSPKEALQSIVEDIRDALRTHYSRVVGGDAYRNLYRDMELMLHEEVEFCPKDGGEKQFTHKPLTTIEGKGLLPSFQGLFDSALKAFSDDQKFSQDDKIKILHEIENAKTLRDKWKALPKNIRNEAKTEALQDGYYVFFKMAWDIIDKRIPDEAFAQA
jgi:hypothetical protein